MKFAICSYALLFAFPVAVSLLLLEDSVVFLAAIAAGAIALVIAVVTAIWSRKRRRELTIVLAGFFFCVAGIASVALWDWPLRVAFVVSRPAPEKAAIEIRNGHRFTSRRVGLFVIRQGELTPDGIACLWTNANPAGRTGLIQTSPEVLPFNLWSVISLDRRWQLISED